MPGLPGMPGIPGIPMPGVDPQQQPMPFVIRMGDRPYGLAQYWTGDGARFRELEPLNPQLGDLAPGGTQPPYPGWIPGNTILIPIEWNPWAKPTPPTGM